MRFQLPLHQCLDRIRLGLKDQNRLRFLRASLLWTALTFLVAFASVTEFRKYYQIGLDLTPIRCMPERLYWVKLGAPKSVQRGDIIAFIAPKGLMLQPFDGKMIAKQVAGLPGDTVRVANDRAYVNGKYIGDLVLNQKLGRSPGGFDRVEVVPPGKLFVIGTLPRSYDGRYWGFLDRGSLVGSVTPLI